jgi:undecaprenyl-diphosphatase
VKKVKKSPFSNHGNFSPEFSLLHVIWSIIISEYIYHDYHNYSLMHEITIAEALFLGLVQGFTEWLPVSSSGHLVIVQSLLGITVPAEFDVVIMFGTIAALILYFRARILSLLLGLAGAATALIGFSARPFFLVLFTRPFIVSLLLIATGIFLLLASLPRLQNDEITTKSALLVGIAQGIAVAPGISRSGFTIGAALLLGVRPKDAAEFSFLVGIPAMTIASVLTFMEEPVSGTGFAPLVVAVIAAFVAGYASIGFFMKLLQEKHLNFFAWYCILAGSAFASLTLLYM